MKQTIIALLFCASLLHSHAADEPLIPAALNAILPKIHARMTVPEVEAVLNPAYPKVKGEGGIWSGQTGYINYKLNERHTLSVSSITRDGKEVVHDELLLYLYDYPAKRRLDLKVYEWEKQTEKNPNQPAAQPAEKKKPDAQVWPPPLDEKRLIGMWVRKNQPTQGVENHTLLVLREDHSWNEAEISGPLTEPVSFKNFANDSTWEVPNASTPTPQATLLFKYKTGGFSSMNISSVGVNELDMSRWAGAIMDIRHYTRCDAQTAAKLNERLNQKDTEGTAK